MAACLLEILVGKPIQLLSVASQRLAAGDFMAPLPSVGNDEIGDLANSFAKMAADLKSALGELLKQNEQLGGEVQEQGAALCRIEQKYRTLYENSADAIMILGENSFLDCNRATLKLFGIASLEEFVKFNPVKLSPPCQPDGVDSLTAASSRIAEAYRNGSNSFEWMHRKASGEDFFAEVLLTVLDVGEKPVLQATVRDISLRKRMEEELHEALVLAEAGLKARSEFLANTTHELVTPLNSVIGFSQVLLDGLCGELNDKQRQYVQAILQSGERLNETYADILQVAGLEAGASELHPERFLLKDFLKSALLVLGDEAARQAVTLALECEVPPETVLEADRSKLLQAMLNLIDNAVKFTPGGGSVRVTARLVSERADLLEIAVTDSGIGIKADDMPRLFKSFQQLEAPNTKKYRGTGLGLLLAKKLVELHGGSIRAESEFGKGSTFAFVIPLGQATARISSNPS